MTLFARSGRLADRTEQILLNARAFGKIGQNDTSRPMQDVWHGKLAGWTATVKGGGVPNFGANLLY